MPPPPTPVNIQDIVNQLLHTPRVYGKRNKLKLGRGVNLENALVNLACGTVTIGNGTFCGHDVSILTGAHDLDKVTRPRAPDDRHIVIGRDVWLASGCMLLGPCTIGDRCVIAARAVVTPRTVCEPGWIYAGIPAKKLRPAINIRDKGGSGPLLLMDLRKKKK